MPADSDCPPDFEFTVDPEFPGDGDWGYPVFNFGRSGEPLSEPDSRWGRPTVVDIEARRSPRWIGMFAAGGLGAYRFVCATPSPELICVVVDGLAYLVDVNRPGDAARVALQMVTQVVPVQGLPLMLLVRGLDIVAIGRGGVAWSTRRLVVDDLKVVEATRKSIVCTGDLLDGAPSTIELDPQSGEQVLGTRLDRLWPPDALA